MTAPDLEIRVPTGGAVDVSRSLQLQRFGPFDPCYRLGDGEGAVAIWPEAGPVTAHFRERGDEVVVRLWGPGAVAVAPRVARWAGAVDTFAGFAPEHPTLRQLHQRHRRVRQLVYPVVLEALVRTILQQRVAWKDAAASWKQMAERWGRAAPGPFGLVTPPDPGRLAGLRYHEVHELGVERRRAGVIREVAQRRARLQEVLDLEPAAAVGFLRRLPGIGPWTIGSLGSQALAHADAIPLGDLWLPSTIAWLLAQEERGDDPRMIALLRPYRPHRARVFQLTILGRLSAPRRAPRVDGRWVE